MEEPVGQISPYAYLFSAAFMIWMLIDAWKRRAPAHWYFIIAVMPFGAVFYFVMVKLRDFREGVSRQSLRSPVDSSPLGSAVEGARSPPDLSRADALEADDRYSEAEPLYRAALAENGSNKRALHGLARCLAGSGKAAESLTHFERLLELDREFAGYGAALDYADALWAADQKNDTIELLEHLAAVTGRINHRLALAHYLDEFGRTERAIHELKSAIEDATGPNAPFTDRHRRWAEMGREMLEDITWHLERSKEEPPSDEED